MTSQNSFLKEHQTSFFWLCVLVVFACLYLYVKRQNNQFRRQITESPAFSVGHFTQLKEGKGSGLEGLYYFAVDGVTYNSGNMDGRYRNLGKTIFDSAFPVIYNKTNPQLNQILVFPTDFADFNLPFPDSLRWVEDVK